MRRPALLAVAAAAVLGLAGCAGADDETGPASSPPASSTSTTTTSTDDGSTSAAGRGSTAERAAPVSRTVDPPAMPDGGALRPDPAAARGDRPAAYAEGCQQQTGTEVIRCEVGDPDGERTVALVGDSKALQWASALDVVGRERGWRVVTMTRSGCPWTDAVTSRDGAPDEECRTWGGRVTDALLDLDPDLVVTSAVRGSAVGPGPSGSSARPSQTALVEGYARVWDEVGATGIPVAALTDTPQPGGDGDVPGCVAAHRDDPDACTLPYGEGSGTEALRAAAERSPTATLVDLTGVLCPDRTCRPVQGDVLVYRDGSHVTDTYARSLAPSLSPVLAELLRER